MNKGIKTRVFLLLLLALIAVTVTGPVYAADQVVGDGTAVSCNEDALRTAVQAVNNDGGGTITFNCGSTAHTILLTKQLKFKTTDAVYAIDGGGLITLDGQNDTRILYTSSGQNIDFTVRNIRLINGNAKDDAADERANNQGGGIYSGYRNRLTVSNATFENNKARAERHTYHGGGAIAIDTTSIVTITDSTFSGNMAPNGGAINNLLSDLTIERSEFRDNTSTTNPPEGGGGAIYNDAGKLTIKDTLIIDNTAKSLGGGIFSWANNSGNGYPGKTKIKNTTIANNSVISDSGGGMGGGLWTGGSYILVLKYSTVANNQAGQRGAGIAGTGPGPNFKIKNSTITGNTVLNTGSGAGVFSSGGKTVVKSSTIAYNSVPNDASSVGAGIHTSGGFVMKNTIVAYNLGGWNNEWSCMGTITNNGNNIQWPSNTCGGGIRSVDPLLGAMTPGLETLTPGMTQVHPLLSGSPALNKGLNCGKDDQRGVLRPQGDACDIGAYEMEGIPPGIPVIQSPTDGGTVSSTTPTFTWQAASGALRYKIIIKNANKVKVVKEKLDAAAFGCDGGGTCSYDLSTTGIALKSGKRYKLKVLAMNDLGKRKAKANFTVE